jgi:signal peptidase II
VTADTAANSASTLRSRRAWIVLLAVTLAGLAIDLISKDLAFAHIAGDPVEVRRQMVLALPASDINSLIPRHEPVTVVPRVLDLTLVLNPGAVFGIGAGKRWVFVVFTAFAGAFAGWMFARWTTPRDWVAHASIGLILAGGIGNLYDRLVFACVRDFLHPLPGVHLPFGIAWPSGDRQVWPWVSNIADALLLVGIAVLLVKLWRAGDPPKPAPEGAPSR